MPVNIIIDSKFDDRGVKNAQQQLQRMAGDAAKRVAQVGAAVAAAGAVAAGKLAVDAVKAASDFEESVNAVNVAFGEAAQGVLDIGENAARSMGLSQNEFNQAATRFSAFAETVVGEGGNVAGFIGDISQRAADFASVFNIEVSEALQVFQSGLAGEAEPLKRFGINLLQSEVAAFAMANGISESASAMTEAEKVQARYGLILEQTAKTQGDFQNTSDSLANSQRILTAELENLQIEIGRALIPVAKDLVNTFANALLPRLEDFGRWINSEEGTAAVREFGEGLVELFEAALDFGGWLLDNLDLLKNIGITIASVTVGVKAYQAAVVIATVATQGLNAAFRANPIGLLVGAFAAVTSAVGLFTAANKEATPTQIELQQEILNTKEELEFYRAEQEKSTNTSKLYESTITDLENKLKDLQEATGQNVRFTKESVIATDAAKFAIRDYGQQADIATGASGRSAEGLANVAIEAANAMLGVSKLSLAEQARAIQAEEIARIQLYGGQASDARSFTEILNTLTARLKFQTPAMVENEKAIEEMGRRLGLVVPGIDSASGSVSGLSSSASSATESTKGLTSSIEELELTMADGVSASDDFLAVLQGIDTTASQASVGDLTRELQDLIVEIDRAGELQRLGDNKFQFERDGQEMMAEFDEAGNLLRSYSMGGGPFADVTNDLNALYRDLGATTVDEIERIQRDVIGTDLQSAINAITGQRSFTDPTTGRRTTISAGASEANIQRLLDQGLVESNQTNVNLEEINNNIKELSDKVESEGLTPFAKGGVVTRPTRALIGEAGPEAVIPLNRMGQMGATYIINVQASSRTGGAQAGEEVVAALKTYNATNGDFNRQLTGFGA